MNDVVGAAEFELRATRRKLKEDLRQAEQDLKNFTNQAERDANDGARGMGAGIARMASVAGTAVMALVTLLGLAATGAMNLGLQGLKMADEISDTARRIAVGTDALQEWRHVAAASGEDARAADQALSAFADKLHSAASRLSAEDVKSFRALLLEPEDLRKFKSVEEALDAVIDRVDGLANASDKAAILDRLGLGAFAAAVLEGADNVAALRNQAHSLGIVMDREMIQRASRAQQEFETLAQVVDINLKSAFIDLAPAIMSVIGLVADLSRALSDAMDRFRDVENQTNRGLRLTDERIAAEQAELMRRYGSREAMSGTFIRATRVRNAPYSDVRTDRSGMPLPAGYVDAGEHFDALQMARVYANQQMMDRAERSTPERQDREGGTNLIIPPGRTPVDRTAEREARRAERVEQEIYRARARALGIYDREALTVQERFDIEQAQVEIEREAERAQLASRLTRGDISQEEFNQLSLIQTQTETLEDRVAADILARDLADERLAQERVLADLTAQLISLQSGAARSAAERRRLELELLEITQQQRRASLRRELERDPSLSDADRQAALNRLDSIDRAERAAVERQSMGPLEAWRDRSLQTADEIREAYEDVAARGLDALTSGITDAIMGTKTLGEVFHNVAMGIIADLASIAVRQGITEPLANMLFGGGKISAISTGAKAASGGGFMGFLRSIFGFSEGGYTGSGAKMEPAGIVHKGEYVLRAEAVRRIGLAKLDALNSLPGFADGGLVGLSSLPSLIPNAALNSGGGGMAAARQTNVFDMRGAVVTEQLMRDVEAKVAAGEVRIRRDVPSLAVGAVADARNRRIIS